jgi:hypothetical protein
MSYSVCVHVNMETNYHPAHPSGLVNDINP